MSPQPCPNKAFPLLIATLAALLLMAGCASEPSAPTDGNTAPEVLDISVSGNRPVIAAGTSNLLLEAATADIDGDVLSFTWTGDGIFHSANDAAKTVRWDVPAGSYGELSVTCTASDGQAEHSRTETFAVGRSLSSVDYGDLVGDTITWGSSDAPFYILQGNVTIPAGITVAIEAGTTVWCDANRLLTVSGSLFAAGRADAKVEFKAWQEDEEQVGYWDGISFQSQAGTLDLEFCNLRNAIVALDLGQGSGLGVEVNSCGFFHSSSAMLVGFAEPLLNGCTVDACSKGFEISSNSRVDIRNCTFRNTIQPALIVQGGSEGSVQSCIFTDFSYPAISVSGGAYVDFHDNSFLGTEQVFLVAGGYGIDPEPLDARCNFWGEGVNSVGAIDDRIVLETGAPDMVVDPWKSSPQATCGGSQGPVLAGGIHLIWDDRHPLFADPPDGIDFLSMAADGYPRLLRIDVEGENTFVHDYAWSSDGAGAFFESTTDWPPFPPEDSLAYPGQQDATGGSELFFLAEIGASGETITVQVTDNWGESDSASETYTY